MALDDLTDAIFSEAVDVEVTRTPAPMMTLGRPVAGTPTIFCMKASIQPLSSRELLLVPEGMRSRGVRKVFTDTKLLILPMPDRFEYMDETWEIVDERDWLDLGNYYRYLATKVQFT